jgi:hypothetical protein
MGPYDPELRSGADAIAPTVPIDPHYRRVSEIAGTVVASCEEASPDPGAYGPRSTSVQGTASIPPAKAAIELPIFLQNALISSVRESRLGMGLSICRSIGETAGGRMSAATKSGTGCGV